MSKFKRPRKQRKSRKVFLIITEGDIEKIYFSQYNQYLNQNNSEVRINIFTSSHTDPLEIVNCAIKKIKTLKDPEIFEKGFCVFDTDTIKDSKESEKKFRKAEALAYKHDLGLITSFPCFELWLLLHFNNYNKPGSKCKTVIKELQNFLSPYLKNKKDFERINFFHQYSDKLDNALNRAKKLESKNNSSNSLDYPDTKIYRIFEAIGYKFGVTKLESI